MCKLRESFEEWVTNSPYSLSTNRFPKEGSRYPWPGQYVDNEVQVAWEAYQEGVKHGNQQQE